MEPKRGRRGEPEARIDSLEAFARCQAQPPRRTTRARTASNVLIASQKLSLSPRCPCMLAYAQASSRLSGLGYSLRSVIELVN